MRGRIAVVTITISIVGLLTGCQVNAGPSPSVANVAPTTHPTAANSDAAIDVYRKYLAVSDAISAEGGKGGKRIAAYVTPDELLRELASAQELERQGLRIAGSTKLVELKVQSEDRENGELIAYTCVDVSGTRVLDSSGKDVTPRSRFDRQTTVSHFVTRAGRLLIDEVDPWSGNSIC